MRPRSEERNGWPENIVARKKPNGIYFTWKDPRSGKEYGLGYSAPDAFSQAREANLKLCKHSAQKPSLTDRLNGVQIRKKWEEDIFTRRSFEKLVGVYMLFDEDEVVYVGQSTNIMRRVARHFDDGKVFTQYSYALCEEDQLDELEKKYIRQYAPKYNVMHAGAKRKVVGTIIDE